MVCLVVILNLGRRGGFPHVLYGGVLRRVKQRKTAQVFVNNDFMAISAKVLIMVFDIFDEIVSHRSGFTKNGRSACPIAFWYERDFDRPFCKPRKRFKVFLEYCCVAYASNLESVVACAHFGWLRAAWHDARLSASLDSAAMLRWILE